ncbi:type II toxin-antitoxin system VapC family toxin [Candidatus Electronema sp. TJ]|uniref:type II toxin-antitoxin system VapC family toxin n=1 Tax=Candidatus Electronema sp. TJ TaxID=3401573 RepID=UPI003AA96BAB
MILCDTNILVEFYKNNLQIVTKLRRIGQEEIAVSSVTQAELCSGARSKAELRQIRQHLALLHHIPLDAHITATFLQLMESYALSHKLSIPDALIAATALTHDLALYTKNINEFRFISGLKLHCQAE